MVLSAELFMSLVAMLTENKTCRILFTLVTFIKKNSIGY